MESKISRLRSLFLIGIGNLGAAANVSWFSPEIRNLLPEPLKNYSGDFSFGAVIAIGAVSTYELVGRRYGQTAGLVAMGAVLAAGIGLMVANETLGLGSGTPAWADLPAVGVGLAAGTLIIHDLRRRFAHLPPTPLSRTLRTIGLLPAPSPG